MPEYELLARAIILAQFENGGKEWNWNTMQFDEPLQ